MIRIYNLNFLFTLTFFLFCYNCSGQTEKSFISTANFTPVSPDAAALGRYGEIPVGYSSGIPAISVPIFEIKQGSLNLPISLSYHASGIKVEDIASVVGLGWTLNAGGAIVRRVIGKADESDAGFLNMNIYKKRSQLENVLYDSYDHTNYDYLENLVNNTWDSQSDIYDVNSPSFTGRFVYDLDKNIQYTPVDRQVKIIRNSLNSFMIIDEDGTSYNYSYAETTTTSNSEDITAWYINSMISANKADTIYFHYRNAAIINDVFTSHTIYTDVPIIFHNRYNDYEYGVISPQHQTNNNNVTYHRYLLDMITFKNGFVQFDYLSDRQDPGVERLKDISIYSNSNLIKKISLQQSYFQSEIPVEIAQYVQAKTAKRLRLDKVQFTDVNSNLSNEYEFNYNNLVNLPIYYRAYVNGTPVVKNTPYDLWGYYNGTSGEYSIPAHFRNEFNSFLLKYQNPVSYNAMYFFDIKSVDRFPKSTYTSANILTRIKYPTGGYTDFEFENNKIFSNGNDQDYSGGLRIKKIISYDNLGNQLSKEFTYGTNGTGNSISPALPRDFGWANRTITKNPFNSYIFVDAENYTISSNSITAIEYYNGSPVFYPLVTEYDGTQNVNKGKIVYSFDFDTENIFSVPYLEKYWNISTSKSWTRGLPTNTQFFKNNSGSYSLIKEIKNIYQTLGTKIIKPGFICERMTKFINTDFQSYLNYPSLSYPEDYVLLNYYDFVDVELSYGVKKLQQTEEISYEGGQQIIAKKEYFYNGNHHLYPTTIKDYINNGAIKSIDIRYAQDKAQIQNLTPNASTAVDVMVSQNILNRPIEEVVKKDNNLLFRNRTDFVNWQNSGRIYEQFKKQQLKSGNLETELEFNSYDLFGNVTGVWSKANPNLSMIWDYQSSYLSAQAINASNASISATSFEADGKGNWDWAVGGVIAGGITGKKSFNLSGNNITRTGLNSSTAYTVTYWLKNGTGSCSLGGTAVISKNGWTLYQTSVTGITSLTISGSGNIDELRLYPKDAQMTTYTYEPLIGMSSQCDVNNKISYYEYDGFGRLLRIRDQDNNIIKSFDYKYLQTP